MSGLKYLFLHGWGASGDSFSGVITHLGLKPGEYMNPDLPGFGVAQEPAKPWTCVDYALWVRDLCKQHDFEPDVIVGHSNGGRISIRLIAQGLLVAQYLILIAPAFNRQKIPLWKSILVSVLRPFKLFGRISIIRRLFFKTIGSPDYHKLQSDVMRQTFRNIVGENVSDSVHLVNVPTLVVWGDGDTYTPYANSKLLMSLFKTGKLVSVRGEGHFIPRKRPDFLASEIQKFVSETR